MKINSCLLIGLLLAGSVVLASTCNGFNAPGTLIDISADTARQTVIAEGGKDVKTGYQGHPTTVLTREGKLICVWTIGHGGPCGPAAESTDGGRTWTRIDERFPKVYRETHKNCPTLQKCVRKDGGERLFVFSAKRRDATKNTGAFEEFSWRAPLGIMISDDGGKTWREGKPAEVSSNMPPTGFMVLKDGSLALFGQVRLNAAVKTDRPQDDQGVWMSVSRDDGETWSPMRIVAQAKDRNLCEPCCIRSPDGKTLALLMRENRHRDCSMMCFSSDEGKTWSTPVLTAPELSGDRHEAVELDGGRYLICFRDQMKRSPTAGQYVGWVGTWDDIVKARPGEKRIRLLNHHGKHGVWPGNEWDTGYSGVEKLTDGTILCTTYSKHWDDDRYSSVVATRLYPSSMVLGSLAETAQYEVLHPRFKKAFDFLRTHDLAKLSLGRHEIDGDKVFANVSEVTLKPWDANAKLEVHRKYIDIQVPVSGYETMGSIRDEATVKAKAAAFNEKDDYMLFVNPAMRKVRVDPGQFIVFFPPYGAHAPCQTDGEPRKIRKVVVKVLK